MLIEVEVYPRFARTNGGMVAVVLKDKHNKDRMVIYVDPIVGSEISMAVAGEAHIRPQTHSLIKSLLDHCGVKVVKAVITRLENNIFHSSIYCEKEGGQFTKDSRPSNAIALAALFSAPIFVEEDLWNKISKDPLNIESLACFDEVEEKCSKEEGGGSGYVN